jgi:hyperosmotically inducible protein
MNIKLATSLLVCALIVPAAGYAQYAQEKQEKKSVTESIKENVGDAAITAKIKTEYAKDKEVSALKINVDTDNKGAVTLKGNVKSQAEADKAVKIAKDTKGVTSVKSELKVAK